MVSLIFQDSFSDISAFSELKLSSFNNRDFLSGGMVDRLLFIDLTDETLSAYF